MSILTISANLTEQSSTKTLAEMVHTSITKHDTNASFVSLHEYPIPICDGRASFSDPNVEQLNTLLEAHSGFVFATPIYNYTINSTLKSLIEHCGRAFTEKPIGFICTAGGEKSFMSLMPTINSMMLDFRCIVLPRFLYVTSSQFNEDKTISDPDILNRIDRFASEITSLTQKLIKL
tara:strand:+ start:4977 stop:5507 length:531 start_codon:yes stop_codon:yes gene_type:complete